MNTNVRYGYLCKHASKRKQAGHVQQSGNAFLGVPRFVFRFSVSAILEEEDESGIANVQHWLRERIF